MATVGTCEIILTGIMPRCRDCQWWAGPGPSKTTDNIWAQCVALSQEQIEEVTPAVMVLGVTAGVRLMTRATFGCVQFEQREPERG